MKAGMNEEPCSICSLSNSRPISMYVVSWKKVITLDRQLQCFNSVAGLYLMIYHKGWLVVIVRLVGLIEITKQVQMASSIFTPFNPCQSFFSIPKVFDNLSLKLDSRHMTMTFSQLCGTLMNLAYSSSFGQFRPFQSWTSYFSYPTYLQWF